MAPGFAIGVGGVSLVAYVAKEAGLVKMTEQEAEAGQESSVTVPMPGEEFDQTDRAAAVIAKG